MKRTLLEIYALAVCFVTVVCLVICLGIAAYAGLGVAQPEFTVASWEYTRHQSNDAYWSSPKGFVAPGGPSEAAKARPAEAVLTQEREMSWERVVAAEKRSSLQSLVKALIVVLIDLLVLAVHARLVQRAGKPDGQG